MSILHCNHAEPLFKGISMIVYNRLEYKLLAASHLSTHGVESLRKLKSEK